jgi:hypothetical protein
MPEKKQDVESTIQAALEEVDRRTTGKHLQATERTALAWMMIQYSGTICPRSEVPSLVESVIRHPQGYSVETVKGLILASPIAKCLLSETIGFHPSKRQQRLIQEMYRQITTCSVSR